MEVLEMQVEEVASSSKRAREGVVLGDGDCTHSIKEDVGGPASKKLCIEEATLCPIPSILELEDLELPRADDESIACTSDGSSVLNGSEEVTGCVAGGELVDDLLVEHHIDASSSTISKEDADWVLRSLEEELGVSSETYDHASSISSIPSSAAQEALVEEALSSWSEEIWSSNEFVATRESSLDEEDDYRSATGSEEPDHHCALSKFESVDSTSQVDIVFLKEASDDELGIPPSPNTERILDEDGMEKQMHETSMRALSEAAALLEADHSSVVDDNTSPRAEAADRQLHEAVSWALQENFDLPSFDDMAAEDDADWLMPMAGSLDFLLDFSTGYIPVAT